jgi:hypothetical protein
MTTIQAGKKGAAQGANEHEITKKGLKISILFSMTFIPHRKGPLRWKMKTI